MLRLVDFEELIDAHKTSVFQILINLLQDQANIWECIKLNIDRRIFDFLMKNVKQDGKQDEKSAAIIDHQKTEEGGTTKIYEVNANNPSPVQCSLMLLTNLTIVEAGQKHLLGEGKTKGAIIENIFGMFKYFKTNPTFDFIANILANMSALKTGRKFMIENNLLGPIMDICLEKDKTNDHRRKQLLACLRNISFEYEDYEADFIQVDMLGKLCKLLV